MPYDFQTVTNYLELLLSKDEEGMTTTLATMFSKLNTLENCVAVTPSARIFLVQYFTDLCEMELYSTGKIIRPNLGNLSLSVRMVSEPGIHHYNLSFIRSGERILKFGTFRTAEWAIAKVRENRGIFCSVDVSEAVRRPIIIRLNSDINIICQKQKRDHSIDI